MARTRLRTTVDATLLEQARSIRSGATDAALVDEALTALLARRRFVEIAANLDSNRLGRLRDTRMRLICAALAVAVDCSG